MINKNIRYYVQKFIERNPFIEDGLHQQYINITGLALILHPYIKEKLKEDISFDAVKMTIFRIGKELKNKIPKKTKLFTTKEIFIKKEINLLNIEAKEGYEKIIKKIKGKYYTSIWGKNQRTLIFDNYYKNEVIEKFGKKEDIIEDLVLIGIKLEDHFRNTPGIIYTITKNLFFYGINIIQVIETGNEFSVVVKNRDLKDAVFAISNI